MKTTEINFPEHAIFYDTCEYELSEKDLKNILEAQQYLKEHPNAMSVHYLYGGDVKLYEDDDEGIINECRIDWSKIIVYNSSVYIQITEKWTETEYEIQINEEYLLKKLNKQNNEIN
jgi:hypothetical protein